MKYLLISSFIFLSFHLVGQEESQEDISFSFRLVSTPGYIELQSDDGCNWLTLSFSLWETSDAVLINQDGMLGPHNGDVSEHLEKSNFLIKLDRTETGLHFHSFLGTVWVEHTINCEEEYCSIQVDNQEVKAHLAEN